MKRIALMVSLAVFHIHSSHAEPQTHSDVQVNSVQTPAEQAYIKGYEALMRGETSLARLAFSESLSIDSHFIPALLGLADLSIRENKFQDAQSKMAQALKLGGDSADVQTAIGRNYYLMRDFKKAQSAMEKAIALDPNAFLPRVDLADLSLNALNKPKEAIINYQAALAIQPDHAGARFGYGKALAADGKIAEAILEIQRAAELSPDNPLPYQALTQLYAQQSNLDGAVNFFDTQSKRAPESLQPHIALGDALLALGQTGKAVESYRAAIAVVPQYALAHYKLGQALQLQNEWQGAESAYLLAIRHDPLLAFAYNNLAWIAGRNQNNLDNALLWAKKAVDLAPESVDFLDTLAMTHHARGELNDALTILEKLSGKAPARPDILYHLGLVYKDSGKTEQSRKALEKVIYLDANHAEANRMLKELQ